MPSARLFLGLFLGCLTLVSANTQYLQAGDAHQLPLLTPHDDYLGALEYDSQASSCPQASPLHPNQHASFLGELNQIYSTNKFKLDVVEALSGAVQIPSESYDGMLPVGEDTRWQIFGKLHEYFKSTFPLVHQHLELTKVNSYGLVYLWKGSNSSLLPILLTGHQDVVPVEPATADQWIHPPYSGLYDGTYVWGRGATDDKASVIALLSTVETFLRNGFKPTRTILMAFGFDEESGGRNGAKSIGQYLEKTYGKNSFAALLDEGNGFSAAFGKDVIFALPCTSEKGYLDVRIEVSTPGGHSSVPPKHTGIGILSAAVVAIEDNPHIPALLRSGTPFVSLQCVAEYGPNMPPEFRKLAKEAITDDEALVKLKEAFLGFMDEAEPTLSTTQAVDIVSGGVKVNALPEKATVIVNHRIAEHSSVEDVQEHLTAVLTPIAKRFSLSLNAFGKNITTGSDIFKGSVTLSDAFGTALQPSPVTPVRDSAPFDILAGTIKATFENSTLWKPKQVVVAPTLAIGNTDTKFYWNLTRHIFRYAHIGEGDAYNGAHTVNEATKADSVVEEVRFFTRFILNWDESSL